MSSAGRAPGPGLRDEVSAGACLGDGLRIGLMGDSWEWYPAGAGRGLGFNGADLQKGVAASSNIVVSALWLPGMRVTPSALPGAPAIGIGADPAADHVVRRTANAISR